MTLLDKIDAFLAETGMSPTALGTQALNDPPFVSQLRAGRRVWPETEKRVLDFMADYSAPHEAGEAA